jgi:hypothetical protein
MTAKWLTVLLLLVSLWNAISAPNPTWNWIILVLVALVFISDMTHKRMCQSCWGMTGGKKMSKKRR